MHYLSAAKCLNPLATGNFTVEFGARAGQSEVTQQPGLDGPSHDYTRHGTATLFSALEVATEDHRDAFERHRRAVFFDFLNGVTAAFPDRQLHVFPKCQHPQKERD